MLGMGLVGTRAKREEGGGVPCGSYELSFCALLDELLGGDLIAVEDPVEIDTHQAFHVCFRQLEHGFYLGNASIGHHDVEGSKALNGLVDEGFDLVAFGDVGCNAHGVAVSGLDLYDDFVDAGLVGQNVVDAYVEAIVCELESDSFTTGQLEDNVSRWKSSRFWRGSVFLTFLDWIP